MKKVKFLTDTAYQGPRKTGEIVNVPDDFAARWQKNGIAEIVSEAEVETTKAEEKPAEPVVEEPEVVATPATDYSNMNAKELYTLCKESGIEVEAKKAKEYYIEKLTAKE